MKRSRLYLTVLIITIALFLFGQISYGIGYGEGDSKAYIIVINRLTLSDIEKMPNVNRLIDEGSIGLMNTRGISGYKGAESFITINASTKAYANNESSQLHNLNDEYKGIYENRVSLLDKDYAIGNVQLGKLYNQNETNNYSPHIGALGDSIHSIGLKTASYGNSDTDEEVIRSAPLIVMDSKGLIDYGNVEDILLEDIDYPYGIRTDYDKILSELATVKEETSLVLVDTGDLNRLNSYSDFLSTDVFYQKRNLILRDIDIFIGDMVANIDKEKSMLMILSPNAGEERIDGNRLSPLILWGKGVDKGILTSSTTNREGVISNLDISPTVAKFLKAPIENMAGNPIQSLSRSGAVEHINSINNRISIASKIRSKTLLVYGIVIILTMLMGVALFILNINMDNRLGTTFKRLCLLLYAIPMILILSSLFNIDSISKYLISLIVLILLFSFMGNKHDRKWDIYLITIAYFIIFLLDLLLNGSITRYSVLSHDPIIGARYFGMGNEMVGVFLAIATLIAGILMDRFKNKLIPFIVLLLSVIMVGHPRLGANVGGTLAILSATLYFILATMGKQLDFKNLFLFAILIGIVIGILGYIDIALNPNPTHLGKTIELIREEGIGITQNIINRKLLMNIKLIGASIWTKVLLFNMIVQVVISYILEDKIQLLMEKGLGKGILSGIVGSLVGLLLNDSGIILSALAMSIITLFILFMVIDDEETFVNGKWNN